MFTPLSTIITPSVNHFFTLCQSCPRPSVCRQKTADVTIISGRARVIERKGRQTAEKIITICLTLGSYPCQPSGGSTPACHQVPGPGTGIWQQSWVSEIVCLIWWVDCHRWRRCTSYNILNCGPGTASIQPFQTVPVPVMTSPSGVLGGSILRRPIGFWTSAQMK